MIGNLKPSQVAIKVGHAWVATGHIQCWLRDDDGDLRVCLTADEVPLTVKGKEADAAEALLHRVFFCAQGASE